MYLTLGDEMYTVYMDYTCKFIRVIINITHLWADNETVNG